MERWVDEEALGIKWDNHLDPSLHMEELCSA